MTRMRWMVGMAAVAVLATGFRAERSDVGPSADEQAIRGVIAKYYASANARDVNAIAATYSPSNTLLIYDVVGAPFRGTAGVRRTWGDFLQFYSRIVLSYRDLVVDVSASGDLAYATFIERAETVARTGGKKEVTDNLRTTQVFRKVAGKWLIVHEHKSAAMPGE